MPNHESLYVLQTAVCVRIHIHTYMFFRSTTHTLANVGSHCCTEGRAAKGRAGVLQALPKPGYISTISWYAASPKFENRCQDPAVIVPAAMHTTLQQHFYCCCRRVKQISNTSTPVAPHIPSPEPRKPRGTGVCWWM